MKLAIVIFRNNLRVNDNHSLFFACKENENILALYSLELLQGEIFGFKKCEVFREKFIKESLLNLKENLLNYNINLCFTNSIEASLEKLSKLYEITIYFDEEVGIEERSFEKKLKIYKYKSHFSQTMIEPFDFDYKKSFSSFRNKAEKLTILEPYSSIDKKIFIDFETLYLEIPQIKNKNKNAILFKGGESEALNHLQNYLPKIHEYKQTRNEMSGFSNSTKFSPYLSSGCISPRKIYYEIKKQEEISYKSDSSYWIYFELLWRDFFHLVMRQSSNKLFLKSGIKGINYNFRYEKKTLDEFFLGKTNVDLIDASINELKTTGWLSNRNRQIVASYFVKNLGLDWRYAAAFFESYLVDYNPASNYGNWAYQSYVGNDSSYRVFDIPKQIFMYNGDDYISKWLNKAKSKNHKNYQKMVEDVRNEVFTDL